jgi:arabinose-5-phosphate isomerase
MNRDEIIKIAQEVVRLESEAILKLYSFIDDTFIQVISKMHDLRGKVIISGMGKSGNIARKISSTLSSTGTPSFYLHPAEAKHGDLGVISSDDVVMLLSNSGETDELNSIINYCKRFGITIIGMTRNQDSTLYNISDIKIILPAVPEASMLGVPTTSSTMMIVYGDAIAVALHHKRNFSIEDYKTLHPGGQIGARLTYVKELMHTGNAIPLVSLGTKVFDAILELTNKRFGCVGVINASGNLVGIITDGDLRRHVNDDLRSKLVEDIMTANPKTVKSDAMTGSVLNIMNSKSITNIMVVDNGKPVGIVHVHDLLRLGVA